MPLMPVCGAELKPIVMPVTSGCLHRHPLPLFSPFGMATMFKYACWGFGAPLRHTMPPWWGVSPINRHDCIFPGEGHCVAPA
jgi:hypothetical protein